MAPIGGQGGVARFVRSFGAGRPVWTESRTACGHRSAAVAATRVWTRRSRAQRRPPLMPMGHLSIATFERPPISRAPVEQDDGQPGTATCGGDYRDRHDQPQHRLQGERRHMESAMARGMGCQTFKGIVHLSRQRLFDGLQQFRFVAPRPLPAFGSVSLATSQPEQPPVVRVRRAKLRPPVSAARAQIECLQRSRRPPASRPATPSR